jgi:hypothetical protein
MHACKQANHSWDGEGSAKEQACLIRRRPGAQPAQQADFHDLLQLRGSRLACAAAQAGQRRQNRRSGEAAAPVAAETRQRVRMDCQAPADAGR